ncbi:MAG: hypothetical protein QNJ40_00025 [Xanthomonadales bacterium]|nr:hypothetical protein [Xanthomonadales bacterium]
MTSPIKMLTPAAIGICLVLLTVASSSRSVELSGSGSGEALIFPLVTARDGYSSLLTVTNTGDSSIAVRLVLRNGADGTSLMTATLLLRARDTWVGAYTEDSVDDVVLSNDRSCLDAGEVSETTATGLSRYVVASAAGSAWLEAFELGALSGEMTHLAEPETCGTTEDLAGKPLLPQANRLSGDVQLINVFSGLGLSVGPTILSDLSLPNQVFPLDEDRPDLADAAPVAILEGRQTTWSSGADAVSAVLAMAGLESSFLADSALDARTDLILTFPTRARYVEEPRAPFEVNSHPENEEVGQEFALGAVDREGRAPFQAVKCTPARRDLIKRGPVVSQSQLGVYFGPTPMFTLTDSEPAAVRAPGFGCGPELESVFDLFKAGLVRADLSEFSLTSLEGHVVVGLPLIAVSLSSIKNGSVPLLSGEQVLSNYGMSNPVRVWREVLEP